MKLTILIMTVFLLQVSASTKAQITLNAKKESLRKVLDRISTQSGYDFVYSDQIINKASPVSLILNNASIERALQAAFTDQPLEYKIADKTVIVKPKEKSFFENLVARFQAIDVSGRVTDENGLPLVGATVKIIGTKRIVNTDADGRFGFGSVASDAVLQISFVGYESREVKASSVLNISLKAVASKLDEVTVVSTGYQTLPIERSAGSFAKPDMNIVNSRSTSMNILQRLDGLIPGLAVNNAPGQAQYLVRGLTTVSINSSPLFVVDGIPISDVSTINPQDIADINVLKDATAASIWGSRAANGVIVINTKKGTVGEKLKVQYDAFTNFQGKPDINYFPVLSSQEFIQAARDTFDPVAFPYSNVSTYPTVSVGLAPHEVILYNQFLGRITADRANAGLDSLASINNNQQIKNLFYRNAMLMNHTVSVSGGQKNYSVYGSIAYTDTRNNSPGQSNDAYKINLRQDFSVGKRVQLSLITDLNSNITNNLRNIIPTNQFYPYQLFKDHSGNNLSMPFMASLSDTQRMDYELRSRISLDYNPLDEVNRGYSKSDLLLSRNIFGATVKLLEGLNFDGRYGFVKGTSRTRDFDDRTSYGVRAQTAQFTVAPTASSTPIYHLPTSGGNYTVSNVNQRNWTIRNQLTYDRDWNGQHQLSLLAGQEVQEQFAVNNLARMKGWDPQLQVGGLVDYKTLLSGVSGVVFPNSGSNASRLSEPFFSQSDVLTRFISYYANAAYTFNRKYTVNSSYRRDQSNNFGLDKSAQNKPVYSVGAKWLTSEEPFMKKLAWLYTLALRATYGLTGNAPGPGTAASYDILFVSNSGFYPDSRGLQISTAANRKLSWERTATINLGLDFSVLENRLSGALDVYQKKTTDLLGNVPTNGFTGYPSIFGNLGDLENKGIELSLTSINVTGAAFSWSTSINAGYNKNKITNLNIATPVTTGTARVNQQFVADYPAYGLFAYQYAGLDNLGDPQIRLADGSVIKTRNVSKPGDIKFMGSTQPPWSGGISNIFNYESFGLSFNTIFNLGHVMRRDVNRFSTGRLTHLTPGLGGFSTGNVHADFVNRWKQAGDEATTIIPSFLANATVSSTRRELEYYTMADVNVVSASFVKMRDITLTYSLAQFIAKKIHADQITLRAQLSNIMLWRANDLGIDPEFQSAFLGNRNLPNSQNTVSFGINVRL